MARHVTDEGLAFIKQWEGLKLRAYYDASKPPKLTIGYGHTGPDVKPGMVITEEQATALLRADIEWAEAAVNVDVKVALNDNQFAALVSFVFNIGASAFAKSTLLRKLNAGDYDGVPNELGKWVNAGANKKVKGLANRRAAEAGLWAKGSFVASNTAPAKPDKVKPAMTPEVITGGIAAAGTAATTIGKAAGAIPTEGPIAYAIAAGIIICLCVGAYYFVHRVRERNP